MLCVAHDRFSRYRDVKEAVQQFDGVVASCITIAYTELIDDLGMDSVTRKVCVDSVAVLVICN